MPPSQAAGAARDAPLSEGCATEVPTGARACKARHIQVSAPRDVRASLLIAPVPGVGGLADLGCPSGCARLSD